MRYRKKPVEIEAVQLRWDNWSEMVEFAGVGKLADGQPEGGWWNGDKFYAKQYADALCMALAIPTWEGLMVAIEGDWVIKGIKGELYPCKPDIFDATYEAVES